ncbi:hypothetical protein NE865_08382 [Phthorimaea operculella]|nr:hypothetical protein NE865_08382 [Phthorimaea operculella]
MAKKASGPFLKVRRDLFESTPPTVDRTSVPSTFLIYNGKYKMCPICQSHICLFYINFTDKMIMCENDYCDFPFGYEKPKILKPGDQLGKGYSVITGFHNDLSEEPPETHSSTKKGKRSNKKQNKHRYKATRNLAEPEDDEEKTKKWIEEFATVNEEPALMKDDIAKDNERCTKENRKYNKNLRRKLRFLNENPNTNPEVKEEELLANGVRELKFGKEVNDVPPIKKEIAIGGEELNIEAVCDVPFVKQETAVGLGELNIETENDVNDVPTIKEEPAIGVGESNIETGNVNIYDVPLVKEENTNDLDEPPIREELAERS